jgi:hypothetical protein
MIERALGRLLEINIEEHEILRAVDTFYSIRTAS